MKKLIIIILFFPTLLLSQVYEGYKDFDSLKFGIDGTVQTTAFTEDTVNSIIVDTVTTMITDSIDVMQTELDAIQKNLEEEGAVLLPPIDVVPLQQKLIPVAQEMEEKGVWSKGLWEKIQEIK